MEMARGSGVEIGLHAEKIPIIPEAKGYALMGLIPAGSYATKHFCEHRVEIASGTETVLLDLIFDPQTSGGLVISIAPGHAQACLEELKDQGVQSAAIVGEVLGPHEKGSLRVGGRTSA